ncbi:MAG TPA: hypothetical protein VHM25_16335, partial [Polyangiaceae bacterium]|nr:hypothetical protein [Polyangiaceae bacterium]
NNQWSTYVFNVDQKKHVYTFRAQSAADTATSFVLDTFRCRNVTPVVSADKKVDFDKGFVPPETSGWFVDNALGVHGDGADTGYETAIHPPVLKADTAVDLTFNCGNAVHSELDFVLYRPGGGTLTLFVDGAERQPLTGFNNQWSAYAITSASGTHSYTFRAKSTTDTASSFVLDTFVCK